MQKNKKKSPPILILVFFGFIIFEIIGEILVVSLQDHISILLFVLLAGIIISMFVYFVFKRQAQTKEINNLFKRGKTDSKELHYDYVTCSNCKQENHATNYLCTFCGEQLKDDLI